MKLGSSLWLRFGLVGAGIGVFGVLLTMIVMSDVKFSSATDGGIVSIATVDTAVGFEMNSGTFDVYTSSSEAAASAPRAIAVYTNSSAGLSFKIGASSNSLVYKNVSTVADAFTAISGSTTLANMTAGTWGYAASTGSNCGNTYKGVPTTPADLISASTFATAGNYNVNLCIGAKGSVSKAEGAYAGQFTLSVTAKSAPVRYSAIYLDAAEDGGATTLGTDSASDSSATHSFTLNNSYTKEGYELVGWKLDNAGTTLNPGTTVTLQSSNPTGKYYAVWEEAKTYTMQTVADWGDELSEGDSIQAIDSRDGKTYWVTRLADGNIWMTQNLDLELSTAKTLTPDDSDVSANWTPNRNTQDHQYKTADGTIDTDGKWDGNYNTVDHSYRPASDVAAGTSGKFGTDTDTYFSPVYMKNGTTMQAWKTEAECTGAGNSAELCQHWNVGTFYSWRAATAGTGNSSVTSSGTNVSDSICPKGWHLPSSTSSGEFQNLVTKGGITASSITGAPYYFLRAGSYRGNYGAVYGTGDYGNYWSSTSLSSTRAYGLLFASSNVNPSDYYSRRYCGFGVRCLADS